MSHIDVVIASPVDVVIPSLTLEQVIQHDPNPNNSWCIDVCIMSQSSESNFSKLRENDRCDTWLL
jgi:hypothetical protein